MTENLNQKIFDDIFLDSEKIVNAMGSDLSREAIVANSSLPPFENWKRDPKLKGFIPLYEHLENDEIGRKKLLDGMRGTRSAGIGAKRGAQFNSIIADLVKNLGYEVLREQKRFQVKELVDVIAIHPQTKKEFLIMCQIDLWEGGQQSNRAGSYLKNDLILKVVYGKYRIPKLKSNKSKSRQQDDMYNLICEAIKDRHMFWVSSLKDFLKEQYELEYKT